MANLSEKTKRPDGDTTLHPLTFHVPEPGDAAVAMVFLVGIGATGALSGYAATEFDGAGKVFLLAMGVALALFAVGVPIWARSRSRREGEIVIDPQRGEIRIARKYEIPFSNVRKVEIIRHEQRHTAINSSHEIVSAQIADWAIDIGAGHYLCGTSGLSLARITKIADALRACVEAYRARTHEGLAPLPRPDPELFERIASVLHEEGKEFEEDWLSLDGAMAEWMRSYEDNEPDEQTMGPNGDFAKALRNAGYDLGDATALRTPLDEGD